MIEHKDGTVLIETEEEMRMYVRELLKKMAPSFDDVPLSVALNVIGVLIRSTVAQVPLDRGVEIWSQFLKESVDAGVEAGFHAQTGGGMDSPLDAGPQGVLH